LVDQIYGLSVYSSLFLNITENQIIVKFHFKFGEMNFSSVVCTSNKNKMKFTICMMWCMMPEFSAETAIV
ncbi:MAG: hypothetical protein RL308_1583, partial [Bacteroidota bacterium]